MFDMKPEDYVRVHGTEWYWIRTSYLLKDETWIHWNNENRKEFIKYSCDPDSDFDDLLWRKKYHYLYFTRHGDNQCCDVTITVIEREWISVLTNESLIKKEIAINFPIEMGTQAGSWKGGVTGTTCEMLEGELPIDTLRRMELNHSFD